MVGIHQRFRRKPGWPHESRKDARVSVFRHRVLRKKIASDDHKYSRGVVAVIAGSPQYPGAAVLAVGGARHGGAGYVKFVSAQKELRNLVISRFPDVVPISNLNRQRFDALVVGPGAASIKRIPELIPVVLDSAALPLALNKRNGITVVTPHEGELAFLRATRGDRREVAEKISKELGVTVVLKGRGTIVASPANRTFVDSIGGPELATAGSGDILAGIIGSMLATWRPEDSHTAHEIVCNAVELHSRAGRHAAKEFRSVTALEIMESLRHI